MESLQNEGNLGIVPFQITNENIGLFGSIINVGSMIAALFSGIITEHFGRKWVSTTLLLPYIIGWFMIAFPSSFAMMLGGRVLIGMATGCRAPISRMYMAEVAHPRHRGRFLSLVFVLVMATSLINYIFALILNWQKLAILNALLPIILLPFQMYLPESHIYYITKNKNEDAKKALQWFRGGEYDHQSELDQQIKHFELSREEVSKWKDILQFNYLKPIFVLMIVMFLRHFSGNTAIMFFMSQIFEMANSAVEPKYAVIILGFIQLIFIIISGQMMDTIGRKKSVVISGIVMGLAQAGMGVYFYLEENPSTNHIAKSNNWLPLVLLSLSMIGYSLGIGAIVIILIGEIVPIQIKNQASGLMSFFNMAFSFLSLQTFHLSTRVIQPSGTFWMYSVSCFLLAGFFLFAMPETKGQSLDEIERNLTHHAKPKKEEEKPDKEDEDIAANGSNTDNVIIKDSLQSQQII
jgi:facilitated trehalose transporter